MTSAAPRVAVFGGSFDPPHVGHVLAVAYAQSVARFDRVLCVPVASHVFGKALAPFADRVAMSELAFADLRGVEVSSVERALPAPSRTLTTLQALSAEHPSWRLTLLVGADVLGETHRWHAWDEVCRLAPPLILGRRGVEHPGAPPPVLPDVSSTELRALLARRTDVEARQRLTALVPSAVLEYVERLGLYA